jgi:hypothetical protein
MATEYLLWLMPKRGGVDMRILDRKRVADHPFFEGNKLIAQNPEGSCVRAHIYRLLYFPTILNINSQMYFLLFSQTPLPTYWQTRRKQSRGT